jgi:hypothetical protein
MLEAPEVEAHHHKTGHALIDYILGGTAVFLSMVSVFIAVRHGQTMEKLVAANSWPNVSYGTGNQSEDGQRDEVTFTLRNTGVGPARIETFELFYKGKPMATLRDLKAACCANQHGKYYFTSSSVLDEVMPARDSIEFLGLPRDKNPPEIWDVLNTERFNVSVRICYCSVFDECWAMDSRQRRPERQDQCAPSQPIQYTSY